MRRNREHWTAAPLTCLEYLLSYYSRNAHFSLLTVKGGDGKYRCACPHLTGSTWSLVSHCIICYPYSVSCSSMFFSGGHFLRFFFSPACLTSLEPATTCFHLKYVCSWMLLIDYQKPCVFLVLHIFIFFQEYIWPHTPQYTLCTFP